MNENEFWIRFWALVAVVLSVLIISVTVYSLNYNVTVKGLVESGASPIEVSCALSDSYNENPVCMALVLTNK